MPSRSRSALLVASQRMPEHLDLAVVRLEQPLADLDGGRLAGAVRAEQAEALAGRDLEIEAVNGNHVSITFTQSVDGERRLLGGEHRHP